MILNPQPFRAFILMAGDEKELHEQTVIHSKLGWYPVGEVYTRITVWGRCVAQLMVNDIPDSFISADLAAVRES